MTRGGRLGVVGGTFDPIHWGHLDAANAATGALALTDLLFVPSHVPPHRPARPHASAFHRFAMTALATQALPHAAVSDIEVQRPGPSYSVETLASLHAQGWDASQIFFVIGADAFAEIATWRGYPALLDLCHFAVVSRDATAADAVARRQPGLVARITAPAALGPSAHGTAIVPLGVDTRPVSSTLVRSRVAAGLDISDLVPPPVATYIARHALYCQPGQDLA
ncbi:MAG: nicotinate-nucleotide adenylyltransferase [Vicinamibacterales bacterium]